MRRVLLAYLTGASPTEIQYAEVGQKKPKLMTPDSSMEFSSSHSGNCGIVVTGRSPLGVDIEALKRPIDYLRIAKRFFAEEEYADIRRVHGNARRMAFFNCWTSKEAYVKALGVGLTRSLRSFAVRCAPDKPPGLRWDNEAHTADAEYRFHRFTDDEYVMTVVLADPAGTIKPAFHSLGLSSLRALIPQRDGNGQIWRRSP